MKTTKDFTRAIDEMAEEITHNKKYTLTQKTLCLIKLNHLRSEVVSGLRSINQTLKS
jgi:hypothetical protein